MYIDQLTLIGVGLIGGSLARAVKQQALCARVCGYDNDAASLEQAVQLGVIDEPYTDLKAAVQGAELIVLAVPLAAYADIFRALLPLLGSEAVITDVGSAKASVVAAARAHLGRHITRFVPGHPLAGRERSGVAAGAADLFVGRTVILTPTAETTRRAQDYVAALWRQVGAQVTLLGVEYHDEVLAATSHLPHMLAYALVDCLSAMQDEGEVFAYAAGGFADFSRIASSNPRMWHDVCVANRRPLLAALTAFAAHLDTIKTAITHDDGQALLDIFTRAKQTRDHYTCGPG